MTDFTNRNLHPHGNYYYLVTIHVGILGTDKFYSHKERFANENLLECSRKAYEYYNEVSKGIEEKGELYSLPFAAPKDYKHGENSCYSIDVYLVEMVDGREYLHQLNGDDEDEGIWESRSTERLALAKFGSL